MPRPLVYLAGPEVFLPDAVAVGRLRKALCAACGFEGLFPLDNEPVAGGCDRAIYAANVAMIRRADFGIFNLTPFRGHGADAGTVFELGLMVGLGKPVYGYTHDARPLRARLPAREDGADGRWLDDAGMSVEDFGNADNLMIDAALAASGHPIVRLERPAAERFRDVTGLRACLVLACRDFAARGEAPPGAPPLDPVGA